MKGTAMKLSLNELMVWRSKIAKKGLTIGEGKAICRELRDKYNLTDLQALDLVRKDDFNKITKILKNIK